MSTLLAFILAIMAETKPAHCAAWLVGDEVVLCDGTTYPVGNVTIVHDRDDGDIIAVTVWR